MKMLENGKEVQPQKQVYLFDYYMEIDKRESRIKILEERVKLQQELIQAQQEKLLNLKMTKKRKREQQEEIETTSEEENIEVTKYYSEKEIQELKYKQIKEEDKCDYVLLYIVNKEDVVIDKIYITRSSLKDLEFCDYLGTLYIYKQ